MAPLRSLLLVSALLAAIALVVLGLVWLFQRRLIYYPLAEHLPPVAEALPGAREVRFATDDGLALGGWFLPASRGRGTGVLVCSGNAGHRGLRAPLASALASAGFSVLLYDYRGYAGQAGTPSEAGLIQDARAAAAALAAQPETEPGPVVYFGESLGAAVAVALAVERPPAALILRSPFTSLVDAGRVHYPWLPVSWLLRDRWASLARAEGLRCPVLVLAGTSDAIVPFAQSRALYEKLPGPHKRFVAFDGAGHNDDELIAGRRLVEEVRRFVAPWSPS